MIFRSNIEYFAIRVLTMYAMEWIEGPELKPADIQFTPVFEVFAFRCFIFSLYRKSTNVGSPIRNAGERKIETCRYLRSEILPVRGNVSAPGCSSIAL